MFKVEIKIGRNTTVHHNILSQDVSIKSYASLLLLNEYYQNLDVEYTEGNDWRYYYIVRRHFLRKQKRINGGFWICHYCKKPIYNLQPRNIKKEPHRKLNITVDHIIPVSKGGSLLDTKNMVECCYTCNNDKGITSYNEYMELKQNN